MRYTVGVGVAAVVVGLVLGMPLGIVSGFFGGWIDFVIQRIVDALLSLPNLLLALALVAALGVGLKNVAIGVGLWAAPGFARIARGVTLWVKEMDYVKAARLLGVSRMKIMYRHILPQ